ncbi:hypothetical protein [Kitasatospora sp. NPDC093102]|uniref:hypothetical protein n=1 Tax=Kitasatospora sp. NPDC093102 TaxID=3155069 RepID=UPI003446AA92
MESIDPQAFELSETDLDQVAGGEYLTASAPVDYTTDTRHQTQVAAHRHVLARRAHHRP